MKGLRNYFNRKMTWGDFWKFYGKCYGIGMIIGFFYVAWIFRSSIREWIDDKVVRFHRYLHRNEPIDNHQ